MDEKRGWLTRNLVVLCGVSFLQDAASELLYPIMPIFLTSVLGAPVAVVGAVEGAAEAVASVTKIVTGRFADRVQRRPLVGVGYGLAAVGKMIIAIAGSWPMVLAGRGVGLDEVARHLDPTLRALMPDPFALADMEKATARLVDAVRRSERIAIFADYDVDGAASAALLSEYLQACGCETIVHIPDRVTEGYGPNREAMAAFAARGASLVVTVDCGAVSHEPIAEARKLGLDVVVFDHHQAPERLPAALAIVDPNRQDDLSGLGHLCAAGGVHRSDAHSHA